MIWLLAISLVLNVVTVVMIYGGLHGLIKDIRELFETVRLPADFHCKVHDIEFRCNAKDQPCLYSPGSEPERICILREEDKKNKGQKTEVIPAPRWSDRGPPGEDDS